MTLVYIWLVQGSREERLRSMHGWTDSCRRGTITNVYKVLRERQVCDFQNNSVQTNFSSWQSPKSLVMSVTYFQFLFFFLTFSINHQVCMKHHSFMEYGVCKWYHAFTGLLTAGAFHSVKNGYATSTRRNAILIANAGNCAGIMCNLL